MGVEVYDSDYENYISQFIASRQKSLTKLITANTTEHIGLEILSMNSKFDLKDLRNNFGKTFLRFVDSDDNDLNDLVITFEMENIYGDNKGDLLLTDAISFGANNIPLAMSLNSFILNYLKKEQAKFNRYIIPAPLSLIKKLKKIILQIHRAPGILKDYNLVLNNGSHALMLCLQFAGMPLELDDISIFPSRLHYFLDQMKLSIYPVITTPDVKQLKANIALTYLENHGSNIEEDEDLNYLKDSQFLATLNNLSITQLEILHILLPDEWHRIGMKVSLMINAKKQDLNSSNATTNLLNLDKLNHNIYSWCIVKDSKCRSKKIKSVLKKWTFDDIAKTIKRVKTRSGFYKVNESNAIWNPVSQWSKWNKWNHFNMLDQNFETLEIDLLKYINQQK